VFDGDPVPLRKKLWSPKFSANAYHGRKAAWIEMPLGTAVRCRLTRHCVRWGPSSPPL